MKDEFLNGAQAVLRAHRREMIKRRVISMLMAVVIVFTAIIAIRPSDALVIATSGVTPGVKRTADGSTMDTYVDQLINDTDGSRQAGRVWSDKSVFAYGESTETTVGNTKRVFTKDTLKLDESLDGVGGEIKINDDFLHVYSALGSSETINEQAESPADVVFLIDMSGSMAYDIKHGDLGGTYKHQNLRERMDDSRIQAVLDAINSNIDKLMNLNPTNQVAVVAYGATAFTLMPLGHYTKEGGKDYLVVDDFEDYNNHPYGYVRGSYPNGNIDNVISGAGYTVTAHGYKTDKGEGAKVLVDNKVRNTYVADETVSDNNIHQIGFNTDMQAGIYVGFEELYKNFVDKDDVSYSYVSKLDQQKYTIPRIPAVFVMTDGGSNFALKGKNASISGDEWHNLDVPDTINSYSDDSVKKYRSELSEDNGAAVILDILMTASYMKSKVFNKYESLINSNEKIRNDNKQNLRLLVSTISVDPPDSAYQVPRIYATMDPKRYFNSEPPELPEGREWKKRSDVIDAYNLWNKWCAQSDGGKIDVSVTDNDKHTTFSFPINRLKAGGEFDVTNEDVEKNIFYNDYFYEAIGNNIGKVFDQLVGDLNNTLFTPVSGINASGASNSITYMDPIGTYLEVKDVLNVSLFGELYNIRRAAIYDYSFNVKHLNEKGSFDNGWYRKTAVDEEGNETWEAVNDGSGSWENGDIYYVNGDTAREFVPTLEITEDNDSITPQQQNTVYTFFRFDDDANTDKRNPCYSDTTFKLSDIRIWVEDTGNYENKDDNMSVEKGYDQAFYVDIPQNALPIQTVTIDVDKNLNIKYTDNMDIHTQSSPLRVYYTVGVKNEILTEDGANVDLSAVRQEYITEHKAEDNSVYFYSNYYSETMYEGYATQAARTRGDAVVSFSPSSNNRYYIFQKNLPIYAHAYLVGDGGAITKVDENNGYGHGVENWTEGASWNGGEYGGEFANEQAVKDAFNKSTVSKGQIVFLTEDSLDNVDVEHGKSFSSNDYFFFAIEYFVPTSDGNGRKVQRVISRLGSEFGSGFHAEGITNGSCICWADKSGKYENTYDYIPAAENATRGRDQITAEQADGKWQISTKVGGVRVGDLAQRVIQKINTYYVDDKSTKANVTETANNAYLPTIGVTSTIENVVINNYLGNNGKLTVNDTMFMVTKEVEDNPEVDAPALDGFSFDVTVDGYTGDMGVIKLKKHNGHWDYLIDKVEVLYDNQGWILAPDGTIAHPNEIAYKLKDFKEGEDVAGSVVADYETTVDGAQSFSLTGVVPYAWNDKTNAPEENPKEGGAETVLEVWRTVENESYLGGSTNSLAELYQTQSSWQTETLYFGYGEEPSNPYPENWPYKDRSGNNIPGTKSVARVTLKDGEGILINGLDSGTDYTVKEVISELQHDKGYGFGSVEHVQQDSTVKYDKNGDRDVLQQSGSGTVSNTFTKDDASRTYTVTGNTGQNPEAAHYVNEYQPVELNVYKKLDKEPDAELTEEDYAEKVFDFTINLTMPDEYDGTTTQLTGDYWFEVFTDTTAPDGTETSESQGKKEVTLVDGAAEFSLKGNEHLTIYGLPVGTKYTYTVSEADKEGWTPQIFVDGIEHDVDSYTGSLVNDGSQLSGDDIVFNNIKKAPVPEPISFSAKKVVENKGNIPYEMVGGEFSFVILPYENNPADDPIGERTVVTNDARGNIPLFENLEFLTKDGVYRYTVEELYTDIIPGMTYCEYSYTVTVTVKITLSDDGHYDVLRPTIRVTRGHVTVEESNFVFDNSYEVNVEDPKFGNLTVSKTVDGVSGTDTTLFDFTVKFVGSGMSDTVDAVLTHGDGTVDEIMAHLTLNESGEYVYDFKLSDAQSITFLGLPVGVAYSVTEAESSGYTLKSCEGAEGKIAEKGVVSAKFVNFFDLLLPELGGIGTIPFYIAGGVLLLAAAVFLTVTLYRKKSKRGSIK